MTWKIKAWRAIDDSVIRRSEVVLWTTCGPLEYVDDLTLALDSMFLAGWNWADHLFLWALVLKCRMETTVVSFLSDC